MEETIKKTVELSCFIVPNAIRKIGYVSVSNYKGTHFSDTDIDELERLNHFNITPIRGEKYVQVWIHRPAEGNDSNWTDHGIPEEFKGIFKYPEDIRAYAPRVLPLNLLKEKKEGDEMVVAETDEYIVTMKFQQLNYRYQRFGTFETVIEFLITRFSEEEDDAWHEKNHEFIPKSGDLAQWPYSEKYIEK